MYIHKILNYIPVLLSICILVVLSILTLTQIWSNDTVGTVLIAVPTVLWIVLHKLLYHNTYID